MTMHFVWKEAIGAERQARSAAETILSNLKGQGFAVSAQDITARTQALLVSAAIAADFSDDFTYRQHLAKIEAIATKHLPEVVKLRCAGKFREAQALSQRSQDSITAVQLDFEKSMGKRALDIWRRAIGDLEDIRRQLVSHSAT